ncbi:DUF2207 family protein [Hamadaea tsunoensis]|uniref:DUF2207 family protein n=1 Tax=Hamadaea tsunoensis TaxID=53368 RepID=UPI0004086702|nr:DUF2207 domain-containing protein [Hamadaea tsunoensis]
MINRHLLDAGIAASAFFAWYLMYGVARAVTRPTAPRAAPATQDLGEEPPAVVSLLVNRWELTEDAAESTLVDLAARGYLEFRQPADDPMHTTIHLRADAPSESLLPFEQQVLDRVRALAVGGVVPVTALTFRDAGEAATWNRRLRVAVVAEARKRGLSRKRFGPAVVSLLSFAGFGVAASVFWAIVHYLVLHPDNSGEHSTAGSIMGAALPCLGVWATLSTVAGRYPGEKGTPLGREVAARWLGVRAWLKGDDGFAALPPAAVAVWDRYLSYGTALGTTRITSAVLDLGLGNRRLVWSSFGGDWHRVKIRYPRFWPRYGQRGWRITKRGVVLLALGVVFIRYATKPRSVLTEPLHLKPAALKWFDLGEHVLVAFGWFLVVLCAYKLIRNFIDLLTPRELTGQLLWVEDWPKTTLGSAVTDRSYLALDHGQDRTTAFARPNGLAGRPGDTVRIKVRRWTRRVIELTVVERGVSGDTGSGPSTFEELDKPAVVPAQRTPILEPLTTADVAAFLGTDVRATALPQFGSFGSVTYDGPDGKTLMLLQHAGGGAFMRTAWRANQRGNPVPGLDAFMKGPRAALKVGDMIVIVTLMGRATGQAHALPQLLATAATRLSGASPGSAPGSSGPFPASPGSLPSSGGSSGS